MRATCFSLGLMLASSAGVAETTVARQFSYEGVQLGSKLQQLTSEQRKDCESSRDKRFVFCELSTQAGEVRMQATLSFDRDELVEVQVFFPSQQFDLIWSALRAKYGMEDARTPEKLEWYSNPVRPDLPVPDELTLFRIAQEQPAPDGTRYFAGTTYALLQYQSLHVVRREIKRQAQEREQKVNELKGKL